MLKKTYWNSLDEAARQRLLQRPAQRQAANIESDARDIVEQVRRGGDTAIREITARIDNVRMDKLRVSRSDAATALAACEANLSRALVRARDNVQRFHAAQLRDNIDVMTEPGVRCERRVVPIATVGLYVPAGSAPLPSSLIMQAVPAMLAGCKRIVVCTPPNQSGRADPVILAAAELCGIEEIYTVGGAQAIAALAYGTESVPRVDKIFGPGNAWVAAAKELVARDGVASDLAAGPSEVMVVADATAEPAFVAADLLAQAEHGADSQVLLLTNDGGLAEAVQREIQLQLAVLPRAAIARRSLEFAAVIVVDDIATALDIANDYAPEHLILQLAEPRSWLERVQNAGSVFLGAWTPEALGDYCSGTNHVLPTGGHARASSGLGVADFQKTITVQEATPDALRRLGPTAATLAAVERLDAHAQSVNLRLERLSEDVA